MRTSNLPPGAILALLSAAMVAVAFQWLLGTNTDVSWLLTVNERILAGERLYVDLHETNPPFSVWLYRVPVLIAEVTGLSPEFFVGLLTGLALIASLALTTSILREADVLGHDDAVVLWIAAFALFGIFAGYSFAQKEHIGLIALLPWLSLQIARAERGPDWRPHMALLVTCGLLCSVMVMVKPHWVLTILLPVALLALRQRSIRPAFHLENLIGAMAFAIYLGAAYALQPIYFGNYLDTLVLVYAPVQSWSELAHYTVCVAGILVVLAIVRPPRVWSETTLFCFAAALGHLIGAWVMGRAFPYHVLPVFVLLSLGVLHTLPAAKLKRMAVLAVAMASPMLMIAQMTSTNYVADRSISTHLARHYPGSSIMAVSPRMGDGHPLVRAADGHWVAPAPSLWVMFFGVRALMQQGETMPPEQAEAIQSAIDAEYQRFADAIVRRRPDIILIPGDIKGLKSHLMDAIWQRPADGVVPADLYDHAATIAEMDIYVRSSPDLAVR